MSFKPFQKTALTPTAMRYYNATLLTNFRTCLNAGNQISFYFDCSPPTLEEYIARPQPPGYTRWGEFVDVYEGAIDDLEAAVA
jgi:hypothetical protein